MANPWTVKYEPKTMDEYICDPKLKPFLENIIHEMPNLILAGPPGIGKGTFINILARERNADVRKINCSDETGIDTIRTKVKEFANAAGAGDELKICYLNEMDRMSPPAQDSLLQLQEDVVKITRFVLVCNNIHKVIPELKSRCEVYELPSPPAPQVYNHILKILDAEGVKYKKATVGNIVKAVFSNHPDVRKTIVTVKQNVIDGVLQDNFTISASDEVNEKVLEAMKSGDPDAVRKVLRSFSVDYVSLYQYLYDKLMTEDKVFTKDGEAILHIGSMHKYHYFADIKEINFMYHYFKMLQDGTV